MHKRKTHEIHYDFDDSDSEDDSGKTSTAGPPHPRQQLGSMLRETTGVHTDGRINRKTTLVSVPRSPSKKSHVDELLRPEPAEPYLDSVPLLYEDDGQHVLDPDSDSEDEPEARVLRDSDDPLAQWVEKAREDYLNILLELEGRGSHRTRTACAACYAPETLYRCETCMCGGELVCRECIVREHRRHPLHKIKFWNGVFFETRSLKELGLRIQLGHWASREDRCFLPDPAAGDAFVIIGEGGVHRVALDFCGCGRGEEHAIQLLRAGLYPATIAHPRTAATFAELDRFQLMNYESKCSAWDYYHSLARTTDNTGLRKTPTRYSEFIRMTREWINLHMLKRAGRCHDPGGIALTGPGECALLCPACPQPGKNLDPDYKDHPEEKQFLYALFLAIDANFRLKRKDVSTEKKDPGLGDGWSFYCEVKKYMEHIGQHWDMPQERSTCVSHDAVDKPDRDARGTASSGIGAVDCARHNMRRPLAVGDLQFGERYINMDYMFFRSVAGMDLLRLVVSYDIACQWHINIWKRMDKYESEIQMQADGRKFITFLVPKFHLPAHIEKCNISFSFNLTPDVGQTDGEAPERNWANSNPLAGGTMQMGPGARRDTLNAHFNDLNWKKIVGLGRALSKKTKAAVPEMVVTKNALDDMERSLRAAAGEEEGPDAVETWTAMARAWEADHTQPNPYEMVEKDDHLAKVRRVLAEEAAARMAQGDEEDGEVVEGIHVTEMLSIGMQLEDNQRTLAFDMSAMGQHATDDQQRKMIERTSKLRRRIDAWMEQQQGFVPRVARLRHADDAARAKAARSQVVPGVRIQDLKLWLPSEMMKVPGALLKPPEAWCPEELQRIEYRLRVGQANEALDDIRRGLLVRTHLYKHKDKNVTGVKQSTRSKGKIDVVDELVRRSAARYRAARRALVSLGRALEEHDWEVALQELREEDVRGQPVSTLGDATRQRGAVTTGRSGRRFGGSQRARKKQKTQPMSWIWVVQKKSPEGQQQAMNDALRIEWAKTRARSIRWREEVDLLEEEMRRVTEFLEWRSNWWRNEAGRRVCSDELREGLKAYALRQASLLAGLKDAFSLKWAELPDLICRGRAGEVQGEEDAWVDVESEEERSGSESDVGSLDEPIPHMAARPLVTSHIDV